MTKIMIVKTLILLLVLPAFATCNTMPDCYFYCNGVLFDTIKVDYITKPIIEFKRAIGNQVEGFKHAK
jgi:hypothetical protein